MLRAKGWVSVFNLPVVNRKGLDIYFIIDILARKTRKGKKVSNRGEHEISRKRKFPRPFGDSNNPVFASGQLGLFRGRLGWIEGHSPV